MTDNRKWADSRVNFFVVCLLSSVACLLPFASFARDATDLGHLDSVEVPAHSEHVVLDAAYISPGGHLVFQVDGLDNAALRANFYDSQTGSWLLPSVVMTPQDLARQKNKLEAGGYSKLEHMPMITLANGMQVYNFIDLKNLCFRPYADFLEIAAPGAEPVEMAIFIKLKSPETIYADDDPAHAGLRTVESHSCKAAGGTGPALKIRYKQQSPFFFSDRAAGFFALVSRYAIHFDGDGQSSFFSGQDSPVFLSANDTRKLRTILASADKSHDPQDAVNRAEALIDRAAQAQMASQ